MPYPFDPNRSWIAVDAVFASPNGPQAVTLSLDTAATQTAIRFSRLVAAGYGLEDAGESYPVATGSGIVQMLEFRLPGLGALGHAAVDFPVLAAHDVPGVLSDGVLGKDFFRDKVLTIDFRNGTIDLQ